MSLAIRLCAGDQFGPFGSMVLVILVLLIFVIVGLTTGISNRQAPAGIIIPENQTAWSGGTQLATLNWLDLIVDQQEITRYISLEVDRSRRYEQVCTV